MYVLNQDRNVICYIYSFDDLSCNTLWINAGTIYIIFGNNRYMQSAVGHRTPLFVSTFSHVIVGALTRVSIVKGQLASWMLTWMLPTCTQV